MAQVQDGGARDGSHVGAVVDGQESSVTLCGGGEHFQQFQLFGGFEVFLAQLDDVHPGGEHGIEELLEVTFAPPGTGAQVEAGGAQRLTWAPRLPGGLDGWVFDGMAHPGECATDRG